MRTLDTLPHILHTGLIGSPIRVEGGDRLTEHDAAGGYSTHAGAAGRCAVIRYSNTTRAGA